MPASVHRRLRQWAVPKFFGLPSIDLEALTGTENQTIEEPIMDHICLPPHFGPADHDDFTPIMRMVRAMRPRIVVELGTAYGNLAANICKQSPEAVVYTVNAPAETQTGELITFSLTPDEIGSVYRKHGYGSRVVQILQNTQELDLGRHFDGPVVDLAIIDACHDTEYVVNDFLRIQPFMRPDGMVLFHDTHPSMEEHLAGSYLACTRLRRRGYEISHLRDTWWAVWVNKCFTPA